MNYSKYMIVVNVGVHAVQTIEHMQVHLIPRNLGRLLLRKTYIYLMIVRIGV